MFNYVPLFLSYKTYKKREKMKLEITYLETNGGQGAWTDTYEGTGLELIKIINKEISTCYHARFIDENNDIICHARRNGDQFDWYFGYAYALDSQGNKSECIEFLLS